MGEIERKVDMLISGMKLPQKKTRSRVATIATSVLIAIALIAGASLIGFYYKQVATVNVESLVTITYDGVPYDAGWEQTITVGSGNFYPGQTEIIGPYIIELKADGPVDVDFSIDITEEGQPCTEGLTVGVYDNSFLITQIQGLTIGIPRTFSIHVTADLFIDTTKTYGYTVTMNLAEQS